MARAGQAGWGLSGLTEASWPEGCARPPQSRGERWPRPGTSDQEGGLASAAPPAPHGLRRGLRFWRGHLDLRRGQTLPKRPAGSHTVSIPPQAPVRAWEAGEALAFGHRCSSHELPADGRPAASHQLVLLCFNLTRSNEITASK